MRESRRITAWSRFVLSLFSALGILTLAACGGGSGAPNNPYAPIPVVAPLSVLPSAPTIYAKIPSSLIISGGTGPYRAFSSNTTILPVQTFVNGNTVPLLAGPVSGPTDVSITIQDSAGQQLVIPVTVLPELTTPPPALAVLPTSLDAYPGTPTQLSVSGGQPPYRAFSSNPGVLPVALNVTNNVVPLLAGAVAADTIVMITVQDGAAQTQTVNVTVHSTPATPPPTLSVQPSTLDITAGTSTQVTINGGVAPYRAFSSNPAVLPVAQNVTGNTVPILASDVAANTTVTLTIQDSANQTALVNVTVRPRPVTPPPALNVQPSTLDIQAGVSTQITISGGVAPYRAFSSNPGVLPVTQNVTGNSVPILASDVAANTLVTLTIQDSAGQTAQVNITVRPRPVTPPPALNVQPSTLDIQAGVSTQITVSGGVAPYRAFSSNPGVLPVTQNVTGNSVPILASDVAANTLVTLTIQDSAGQTAPVNITVRPRPVTPPPALSVIPAALDVTSGIAAQITIVGGVAPYRAFSSNSAILAVPQDVVGNTVTLVASPVTLTCSGVLIVICDPPPVVNLTIQDAAGQTAVAAVTVHPQTPPTPLSVQPSALDLTAGVSTQVTISGGVPPYRAFSSNPGVLPVTQTVTGNTVPLLASDVTASTIVTLTIQDSANQTALVTVTVRPRPSTIPPALSVQPGTIELLSGISSQVTIIGGVAPYRAFSSSPVVLPVTQDVTGNTVPLLAADVAAATTVTLTIQDAANQTATVNVTVRPRPTTPPPALVVLPTAVDAYSGIATQVSVTGGVGPYRAFSSNTAVLPVTETVAGSVIPLLAGTVTADTRVVLTVQDSTGQNVVVNVTVHPSPTTPPLPLSVIPAVLDVTSGVPAQIAISGGVAPYRAFSSNSALLPVTQDVVGSSVSLLAAQATCNNAVNPPVCPTVNITVQDSVGQTAVAVVTVHPASTTPPPALTVLPTTLELFPGVTTTLLISGGAPPYNAFSSNPAVLPVTTNVASNTVTLVATSVAADTRIVITIQDSSGQTKDANVTVHPTPSTPAAPLTVIPTTLDAYSGITTQVAIDGGQPPYRAFSTNTSVLPVTDPVVGNIVPLVPGNVTANTTVTLTIRDTAGQSVNVAVTVHPASITPPTPLTVLPTALDAYSGIATQVAVDGGTPPYRAFSSNTAVLPVTDLVVGNVVPLVPGNVTANTPVTLIVRDAGGQSQVVNVTVHPAPTTPAPALIVLPSRLDAYAGIMTQLTVSGGVAPYGAFSTNPAVITVAQSVIGNTIPIVAAAVDVDTNVTITVQDGVGQTVSVAIVVHPKPATPPPALSVLPANIEVVSGTAAQLTVVGGVAPYSAFSANSAVLPVTQSVPGNSVTLLAAPVSVDTKVNITIQDAVGQTVVTSVTVHPQPNSPPVTLVVLPDTLDVYPNVATPLTISGGIAPYKAFSSNTAVLPVTTNVLNNVVTLLAAGVAADTKVVITIQDSAGQTATVNATVHPTPATPPPALVVLPTDVTVNKGVAVTLTISGGLAPYKAYSGNPGVLPVNLNVTGNSVVLVAAGVSADTNVTVTIQDSAGQTVPVIVHVKADAATPPPPLAIVPAQIAIFAGSPASLVVTGGTPPYQALSGNPAVLPVTQAVAGNTIPLFANNVSANTDITITVLDSDNKNATATVTVQPSTLLNTITITPDLADCGANTVCSGQTAVASVTVTAPGGGGIAGRQVRYDVVQGSYGFVVGGGTVQSTTVVSDASGTAKVVLLATINAPTQVALIRATDVTTGQQVTGNFVIAQTTNGQELLSVLPDSLTLAGPDATHCSSGVPVNYYIFGGTPPYRVVTNLPSFVTLPSLPIIVPMNGGSFTITTNGSCFDLLTFVITDATARTVTATLTSTLGPGTAGGGGGANCGFSPPDPTCLLQALPNAVELTACTGTGSAKTALVTGGTKPYAIGILPITAAQSLSTFGSDPTSGQIVISRLSGSLQSATPVVRVTSAQGGQLVDIQVTFSGSAAGTCP